MEKEFGNWTHTPSDGHLINVTRPILFGFHGGSVSVERHKLPNEIVLGSNHADTFSHGVHFIKFVVL